MNYGSNEFVEAEVKDREVDDSEKSNRCVPNMYGKIKNLPESSLIENAVIEASNFIQVDYEMALVSALGAISACCQGLVDVSYPNGYTVPTSLMIITLAGVSERKTSLDNQFSKTIRQFQKDSSEEEKTAIKKYNRQLAIWKRKEKALNKEFDEAYASGGEVEDIKDRLYELDEDKPRKPPSNRIIYERATPSALLYSMHENISLAYFLSDEAGSLLMGPSFDDFFYFNSLWSGSDITIDRRNSESFLLSDARLSVNLMMQPEIFRKFLKHKRGETAYESGFFARFLISCPKSTSKKELSEKSQRNDVNKFNERLIERLKASIDTAYNKRDRTILQFSGSACELFRDLNTMIENETEEHGAYYDEKGHARKLIDNVARVAALIHTFENEDYADREISESTLFNAFVIVNYLSSHYMNEIAAEPEIVKLANSMVRTIRKHGNKDPISFEGQGHDYRFDKSIVKRNATSKLREAHAYEKVLNFLKDLGHITQAGRFLTFHDTIARGDTYGPKIRNGESYYVEEIARFEDQQLWVEKDRGNYGYFKYKIYDEN